jgi:GAF domain-containing protein
MAGTRSSPEAAQTTAIDLPPVDLGPPRRSALDPPPDPFERVARLGALLLDAPMAAVMLGTGDDQRVLGCHGICAPLETVGELPSSAEVVTVGDLRRDPSSPADPAATGSSIVAYASAPLSRDDRVVGTLCVLDVVVREWSATDRAALADLAATAVTALEAHDARERVERQAQMLEGLTQASGPILRSGLPLEHLLHEITQQVRLVLGAHQCVTSLTTGTSSLQWITAVDLSDRYAAWRAYQVQPDGSGIYELVRETKRPMRMTQEELVSHPRWRGFGHEAGRHPPMRGWLAAPLISRDDECIGLIQLSDKDSGEFTAEEEAVLMQFADLAACAVEDASMLLQREHVTNVLQASLFPQGPPAVAGLEIAARYKAAVPGQVMIGDFYDVSRAPDGTVALTIADASGQGPDTTAMCALVRYTLRALEGEASPAGALARVNRVMLRQQERVRFVTAVHAHLHLGNEPRLTAACAGQIAPIILRPGESGCPLRVPGQVLGALDDPALEEREVALRSGDTVVLYTGGVAEAWRGDTLTVVEFASRLSILSTEPPEVIADALEVIARDPRRRSPRQDVGILVVRIT